MRIHIQIVYHIHISSRIYSEYIRGYAKMICSYLLLFYLILADSSFYVYFSTFSYNMYLSYLFVCWLVASVIAACSLFYIIYASYIVIFIYVIFMSVCLVLLIYFIHCIIVIMFIAPKSSYSVYYYYTVRIRIHFTLVDNGGLDASFLWEFPEPTLKRKFC